MNKIYSIALVLLSLTLFGAGCSYTESTQGTESVKQEAVQKELIKNVPIPEITRSTARQAIADRAKLFDAENKITYIYLVSYGKVMAFYTVKGQVMSLRSYLTPMENIVNVYGTPCILANRSSNLEPGCSTSSAMLVSAPDLDGTYGDNVNGIFFFTAEGAYVEWSGEYMMSDQPLKLTTQPELVREIE